MQAFDFHASLQDCEVVVIGGGTGIGFATALAAKARGARITLIGRDATKLKAAAAQLGGARISVADIADRASVEAALAGLTRIDHLVITAGSLLAGKLAESDPDTLLKALQERIAGPLYAIKASLTKMPGTGSIVLMGGQFSDRPAGNGTAVISAAVRGIEGLARALAQELAPIRVNVISPGFIDTPLFDVLGPDDRQAVLAQAAAALPVGRVGHPEEVARGIAFLLTNGYMTGEVLHIDGGGRLV